VTKCLVQMANLGLETITLPTMGMGNLGYPSDLVAREMLTAIHDFVKKEANLVVNLLVFQNDSHNVMKGI
jgi:O-acetyl-ADP-ribose deacetylase (regulator of RNase III)